MLPRLWPCVVQMLIQETIPEDGSDERRNASDYMVRYMIYLLSATGLSPGGRSTVHIYTRTIHRTTQITTNLEECGPCPVFASFTLAFALQLREKARKNLSQGTKNLSQGKKSLS